MTVNTMTSLVVLFLLLLQLWWSLSPLAALKLASSSPKRLCHSSFPIPLPKQRGREREKERVNRRDLRELRPPFFLTSLSLLSQRLKSNPA